MGRKYFFSLFFLILLASLVIHLYPTIGNNFYFTVDQGNDAVQAREWFERGVLLVKGPETGISGVFAGPLWFYFIGIGYKLYNGDPFGGLLMVILLNVGTTAFLMWILKKNVSWKGAILVGISLQFSWHFFDSSRYTFNPFPTVFLSILQIVSLISFLEGKKKGYWVSLLSVLLVFNCAVATGGALLLFHLGVGLWGLKKNILSTKEYLIGNFIIPGVVLSPILWNLFKEVGRSRLFLDIGSDRGYFADTNFLFIFARFVEIFQRSIVPYSLVVSILVFMSILFLWAHAKKKNVWVFRFTTLTFLLWGISFLWFGSNKGWQDWHTIYLYTLTYISVILLCTQLPRKFGVVFLTIILSSQFFVFKERYFEYLKPTNDYSLLSNRLAVIDWIYQNREGEGFNVYTFTPHIYDYPTQYLFSWYGKKVYGFLPCEYSVEPGYLKQLYIPGADFYSKPTLGCEKFRYLILEPGVLQLKKLAILEIIRRDTLFIEKKEVGGVLIEKRRVKRQEEF